MQWNNRAPQGLFANLPTEITLVAWQCLDKEKILSYLAHHNPCPDSQHLLTPSAPGMAHPHTNYLFDIEEEEIFLHLLASIRRPRLGPTSNSNNERAVILQDRVAGHKCVVKDCFSENPVYNERMFEGCFRMSRSLFEKIGCDLQEQNQFWIQKAVSKQLDSNILLING